MNPAVNVTFLFTDIEGSTKLSQNFPDKYYAALERHNEILKYAVESNNGNVFKIIGDAFCCAFEKAEDAVKAAVEAQINLTNERWDEAVIKVRIGIHSGKAEWNGTDYTGYLTLARTARVMSSAYGEQILISNDAYELCLNFEGKLKQNKIKKKLHSEHQDTDQQVTEQGKNEPDKNSVVFNLCLENDVTFRDLGERRLKDVFHPVRLFQIIYPGLRDEFPPLKTLDARPNNLPVQLTSFIGREEEMNKVKNILRKSRLLTITGPGGSGKTRLAMQTGADLIDDFSNGVFIAELAPLTDKSMIVQKLMDSIGIKEEPGISLKDKLVGYLKDLEILIIIDNCEHLINECAKLAEFLLSNCLKLKIIATSRESLNCSGEHTFTVPSLAVPESKDLTSPEKLIQFESIRLFIERSLSVNSNFRLTVNNARAITEICRHLDGIPLAIELAAARSNILTPDKINDRLSDRFKLLSGGKRTALPRQKTLKALIDWSYDLLSEKERILWHRITVFSGGWTLEAAENIVYDGNISIEEIFDLLGQLVDKSVIIFNSEKNRYSILETMKQYGNEKLKDSNEENEYRSKHLKYYTELSYQAEPELIGSEVQIWLEKLESEHGNFQSAINWAISENKYEEAACLAGALGSFWEIRGYYSIGIKFLESILLKCNDISKPVRAKVLLSIGILARNLGDFELSQKTLNDSLEIYREIQNKSGIVVTLNNIGISSTDLGNFEQAKKFHEESMMIANEIGDKNGIAVSLISIGTVYYHQGNYAETQKYYEESLKIRREIGNIQGITMCLNNLGSLHLRRGNIETSKKLFEEGLKLSRQIGDKTGIGMCLNNLGKFESEEGNTEKAYQLLEESLSIWRELGDKLGIVLSINNLGILEINNANYDNALRLYKESLMLSLDIGYVIGIIESLIGFSGILSEEDHHRSVKIIGAVQTALKSTALIIQPNKLNFFKHIISTLNEKLGKEEYNSYLYEGEKMTLEEACKLVLDS